MPVTSLLCYVGWNSRLPHCRGGVPAPPGGGVWLGGTRRIAVGCLYLVLPVPPHFFGLAQRNGVEPQRKALLGGGAPVRFRDPPASPTRVGAATRPLRCPLRGRIESLAPGARGLGWRKSSQVKVFCPAFLQKSGRGPGAAPLAARRSARNSLLLTKRRRGLKGEPSPGVPPLRAAPAARSPCDLRTPTVIRRRAGIEPRPYEGV